MQAVIFFAFFLLVDLFGLADFVVFLGNGETQMHRQFFTVPYTPNFVSVNQYNSLDVLLKNLNEWLVD